MAWCVCGLWLSVNAADNFSLADGSTLSGDIVTFNDAGVIIRLPGDKYTDRMPWTKFSQEGLQQLGQNPKIKPLVEPFMELPPTEKVKRTDTVQIKEVSRLAIPAHKSVIGGLASSSVGLFLLFLIYAANLYAGFEVAACRGRPVGTVMGLSAVVPIIGPAIFFLMPTNQVAPVVNITSTETEAAAAIAVGGAGAGNTAEALAAADIQVAAVAANAPASVPTQTFKRGQFTFNRRFFETKFAGFFKFPRSESDQKLELSVKTPAGLLVVQRISQLGQNEVHLEVLDGAGPQVIQVPFGDIQEINLKPIPA